MPVLDEMTPPPPPVPALPPPVPDTFRCVVCTECIGCGWVTAAGFGADTTPPPLATAARISRGDDDCEQPIYPKPRKHVRARQFTAERALIPLPLTFIFVFILGLDCKHQKVDSELACENMTTVNTTKKKKRYYRWRRFLRRSFVSVNRLAFSFCRSGSISFRSRCGGGGGGVGWC